MGFARASVTALGFVLPFVAATIAAKDPPPLVLGSYPLRADGVELAVSVTDAPGALAALRDAVAANDLHRLNATLPAATALADSLPLGDERNALRRAILAYRDLEQVWSYAASHRFGAFYDDEALPGFHDRLASDYPGYDAFMADYRITDRTGRQLYATAETRAFLLKQIKVPVPRPVQVARLTPPHVGRASARPAHRAEPPPAKEPPPRPAPVIDPLATDMRNAAIPAPAPARVAAPPKKVEARTVDPTGGRGIVFIVMALIGIGILTTLVRTDRETEPRKPAALAPPPAGETHPETRKRTA